jgi:hypothetical protein
VRFQPSRLAERASFVQLRNMGYSAEEKNGLGVWLRNREWIRPAAWEPFLFDSQGKRGGQNGRPVALPNVDDEVPMIAIGQLILGNAAEGEERFAAGGFKVSKFHGKPGSHNP